MVRTLLPVVAFLLALVAPAARALTMVPAGVLPTPATWDAAGSPYILTGDVRVIGGSLTIEANTVVQFAPTDSNTSGVDPTRVELSIESGSNLGVAGNVRFEPQAGNLRGLWYGIRIENSSSSIAAGTIIRGAHTALHLANAQGQLQGLDIRSAEFCGIRGDFGTLQVSGATITDSGVAICLYNGLQNASVNNVTVTDSTTAVRMASGLTNANHRVTNLKVSRVTRGVFTEGFTNGGNLTIERAVIQAATTAVDLRAPGVNVTFRNSTIANNRTSFASSVFAQLLVQNSQVTYHQNPPALTNGGFVVLQHSNYFQSGQEATYATGDGMLSGSPAYQAVTPHNYVSGTGDFHLTANSTGVNRGLNVLDTAFADIDGAPRPYFGGTVDMGAYEFQGQATQSITFPFIAGQQATAAPFTPPATASSGLPVQFQSTTPTVCTTEGFVVTLVGRNGQCALTATQPGNNEWQAALPQLQGFNVTGAVPRVQVTPPQLDFGPRAVASFTILPVTVRNAGYMPMTVAAFVNDAAIQGVLALAVNDCPSTLQEQQECQLFISFNPMGALDYTANLRINTNDPQAPQVVVPLAGQVPPPDVTPDPFAFNTVTNATPGAVQVSNTVTITGIETAVLAVVTNGEFSIGCNGNWQTFMNIVANGQTLCVRHTAPLALNATTTTSLQVGTVSRTFVTTTIATLPAGGDYDQDGIPNDVEAAVGRNRLVKDNDIFTNLELFVMQQYRDFLGREADAAGLQYFTDLIATGAASREEAIALFLASPEFQTGLPSVIRLYFSFFDRIPDAGGLQFQVDAARAGTPLEVIAQNFYNSPEFTSRFGALSNDDYINLVYQQVLGRAPDAGGFAYYKNLLDTNAITKGQMMIGFSESPEFQQLTSNEVYAVSVYFGLLRRTPEAGGLDFYADLLDQGLPRVQVLPGFFNSAEYRARFLP